LGSLAATFIGRGQLLGCGGAVEVARCWPCAVEVFSPHHPPGRQGAGYRFLDSPAAQRITKIDLAQ